jgi:pentatricopeptide repeat protein
MLRQWKTVIAKPGYIHLTRRGCNSTAQRTLINASKSWRSTFESCENPTQLGVAIDRLFQDNPKPRQRILVHAIEACSRLAEQTAADGKPSPENTVIPIANRLDAYLLSLDQRSTATYDKTAIIQLAQDRIIANVPTNRMTAPVYAAYLYLLANWSDLPTTLSAFNQAKKVGILPDLDMYKALIKACAKTGDYDAAYRIIDEAATAALKVMKTGYWLQIALRLTIGAEVGKYTAIGLMGLVPDIGTTIPAGVGLTIGVVIGARLAVGTALREATMFLPTRTYLQQNIAEQGANRDQQVRQQKSTSVFGSLRDVIPKSDKDVRVELNTFMVNEFRRVDKA